MFRLCSKCTKTLYDQFFEDLDLFATLKESDERIVMMIKMCFEKALLDAHHHSMFQTATSVPALNFFHQLKESQKGSLWRRFLNKVLKATHWGDRHNRHRYVNFPDREILSDVFREQLGNCKRITYRLPDGTDVITEKRFEGDEVLLPYNVSDSQEEPIKYFHNFVRGISRNDLKRAEVVRVDDSLINFQNASLAEFAHHSILLMVDYLYNLMSFDDVFTRLRKRHDQEAFPSLCLNCRDNLKQMGWRKSRSYENECMINNACFTVFDIVLYFYFARAVTISVCHLDSLGVAAEHMSTLQVCRGCMERGIIPGDEECFQ